MPPYVGGLHDQHEDVDIEKKVRLILTEGPNVVADSDGDEMELPDYFDLDKFRIGQRAFYNNLFTMMVAKLSGLYVLIALPSVLDLIVFTKQSSTPCTAFRRYVSTIFHTVLWYKEEPVKNSEFFKSMRNVRRKHYMASKRGTAVGLPRISQFDMALTQFGFIGFTLLCSDELGISLSDEEFESLVHFWRVIGALLNTEERFNLCTGTVEETKALCRRLLDEVFLPNIAKRRQLFEEMGRILIVGLWPMNPHLDPDAFSAFTFRMASRAAGNNNHSIAIDFSKFSYYSLYVYNLQKFVHRRLLNTKYLWSPLFRSLLNGTMYLALYLMEKWPFLAHWQFGVKESQFNMYKYHFD